MRTDPITLAADRRSEQRIEFTELLWSCASSSWSGFAIERHRIGPSGRLHDFAVRDILLALCVSGSAEIGFGSTSPAQRVVARPGSFTMLDIGDRQPFIEWSGTREMIVVRVEAAQLRHYFPDRADANRLRIAPQYWRADPHVARLVSCMHDEVRAGCPGGSIYAQSLSLALSSYLFNRFPAREDAHRDAGGASFTNALARRLTEHVRAHLGQDLRLTEMAAVAGLSPHYFLQKFKHTFGTTPHHYLLSERIQEAKRLLKGDEFSIGQIGLRLGFSDQSHFTATFRKLTGTTPRRFKRGMQAG